jgi:hypothetical protein
MQLEGKIAAHVFGKAFGVEGKKQNLESKI